jgi:hypothetical protein
MAHFIVTLGGGHVTKFFHKNAVNYYQINY